MRISPSLSCATTDGIRLLVDRAAARTGLVVAFSGRDGGVSAAPYDTLNLAMRVGDDPGAVAENRRRVASAAGFDPAALALARQVHGSDVVEVSPDRSGIVGDADALVARGRGPVLGILTADCAPVVVAGSDGVAVLHAGWRGLVGEVVRKGVAAVGAASAAWIGPAIGGCCYQVGDEVIGAFEAARLPVVDRSHVDPALAARAALAREGVDDVAVAGECTSCDHRYFSYRRDRVTGRQGAFASITSQAVFQ